MILTLFNIYVEIATIRLEVVPDGAWSGIMHDEGLSSALADSAVAEVNSLTGNGV